MSPHIHRENGRDVEAAFRAYIDTTGDKSATLSREGATWIVSGQHLKGSYYGAREACAALRHFLDGWGAGSSEHKLRGRPLRSVDPSAPPRVF